MLAASELRFTVRNFPFASAPASIRQIIYARDSVEGSNMRIQDRDAMGMGDGRWAMGGGSVSGAFLNSACSRIFCFDHENLLAHLHVAVCAYRH